MMLSGLCNDVMVRVVSLREIIEALIVKNNLTTQASKALAEVMLSTVLMGGGLKDSETLQVQVVGTSTADPNALRNVTCIVDGNCKVRGRVGNPNCDTGHADASTTDLLGRDGRLHISRHHPSYKQPMSGIVELRPDTLAHNLARYVRESEQRECVIFTDVSTSGTACHHALAVLMEHLPRVKRESTDLARRNLTRIEQKGLVSYLEGHSGAEEGALEAALDQIRRDCFADMSASNAGVGNDYKTGDADNHLKWKKHVEYSCTCGVEKVWRTLRMLPMDEIRDILDKNECPVAIKCDFCGNAYSVPLAAIRRDILEAADARA